MLQSPFAEPTPTSAAGAPPAAPEVDRTANDINDDTNRAPETTSGEQGENGDAINVVESTNENRADENRVQDKSDEAAAPGNAFAADAQNDSPAQDDPLDDPSTETPTSTPVGGTGSLPDTPIPGTGGGVSPLPTPTFTPTNVNHSPLPTPTFTPTNMSVPATATRISVAPTSTATSRPPFPPVVTVQPTTVVLPPTEPTTTSAYPTPIREAPTSTPEVPASALRLDGYWVQKVIGDRFSSVIYAFANGWLYRSTNDGATWALLTSMPVVDDFVMNADDPNILFSGNDNSCAAGAPNGPMLKSTNGGLSWFELPNSSGLRPLITHPFKPAIIVAADCQWLYISEDGGNSWHARPDLTDGALWQTYSIVSAAAVYTEDTEHPDDLAWQRLYVGGRAADGSGVIAFTEDLGQSWQQITPKVHPAPWGMSTIALDPFNANRNWFADRNGIWYTPDGGVDWRFTYEGLNIDEPEGAGSLVFMVMHPTGQIYLGAEHGLYTKVFDGIYWVKVANTAFDQTRINSILFTETNANLLYLNTGDGVQLVRIEG